MFTGATFQIKFPFQMTSIRPQGRPITPWAKLHPLDEIIMDTIDCSQPEEPSRLLMENVRDHAIFVLDSSGKIIDGMPVV